MSGSEPQICFINFFLRLVSLQVWFINSSSCLIGVGSVDLRVLSLSLVIGPDSWLTVVPSVSLMWAEATVRFILISQLDWPSSGIYYSVSISARINELRSLSKCNYPFTFVAELYTLLMKWDFFKYMYLQPQGKLVNSVLLPSSLDHLLNEWNQIFSHTCPQIPLKIIQFCTRSPLANTGNSSGLMRWE